MVGFQAEAPWHFCCSAPPPPSHSSPPSLTPFPHTPTSSNPEMLQSTQKHRGFAFVTFLEKEDAAAAMDNMHCAELYGRVLSVNIAAPMKIKGGETGWAAQPGGRWGDVPMDCRSQQQFHAVSCETSVNIAAPMNIDVGKTGCAAQPGG